MNATAAQVVLIALITLAIVVICGQTGLCVALAMGMDPNNLGAIKDITVFALGAIAGVVVPPRDRGTGGPPAVPPGAVAAALALLLCLFLPACAATQQAASAGAHAFRDNIEEVDLTGSYADADGRKVGAGVGLKVRANAPAVDRSK